MTATKAARSNEPFVFGNLRSRRAIAAASTPAPQLTAKYLPSATPRWMRRETPAASIGSVGSPRARARMFVAPPGRTPSATSVPARPFSASLIVPSPENTTTRSTPSSAACRASSVAWPRSAVSTTSSLKSADKAFSRTARVGFDTVRATGFTTSSRRWNRCMGGKYRSPARLAQMTRADWFRVFLFLHALGAVAALGPTLTYGLWVRRGELDGPGPRAFALRTISWIDRRLATPPYVRH